MKKASFILEVSRVWCGFFVCVALSVAVCQGLAWSAQGSVTWVKIARFFALLDDDEPLLIFLDAV